tara:strand:- start:857 stop:1051 length:195 start_codon:yes stop_codon:yes gene_type:complete
LLANKSIYLKLGSIIIYHGDESGLLQFPEPENQLLKIPGPPGYKALVDSSIIKGNLSSPLSPHS